MKRNIYWGALALALGLASAGTGRAQSAVDTSSADQAASSATADVSAGADAASTSADTGASTSGSTSVNSDTSGSASSETQSSSSGSQSTSSDTSASQSVGDASASADTQADASVDTQSSNVPAPATPSASTDADASVQAGADINASANQGTTTATTPPATPNISANTNADADLAGQNQNADVNASAQGQANLNGNAAAQRNLSAGLQFGQATGQGLALSTVARNSFFYNSGLRPGDVLVSYGGRPIRSHSDFSRWAVYQPGQRVPVIILRDGRRETIYVTYHHHHGGAIQHQAGYAPQPGGAYLGLTFDPHSQNGAMVRSVAPGSPADQAGIRPGHLIVAVNGQQVANHQEVIGFVAAQQPGTQVDLAVSHPVVLAPRPNVQASAYQSNVQIAPAAVAPPVPTAASVPAVGRVETGVYERDTANVRVDGDAVARPADADRDGRVLDGDGRAGPRERAGLGGRRR